MWDSWQMRWRAAITACRELGGDTEELVTASPAREQDIVGVESALGFPLPTSFRFVLLEYSSRVEARWTLPEEKEPPGNLKQIFAGDCSWDLNSILEMNAMYQDMVQLYFADVTDPAQRLWHEKLVFCKAENGDYIAIDLTLRESSPVLYLSPFRRLGHGYELASDFISFIDTWTLLGCPGPEIWQMLPFISSPTSGLEPYGEMARTWRNWFGLSI